MSARSTLNSSFGHLSGDAAIKDVDHTANRVRAIQQCAGAADHFDPFDAQALAGYRMVGADCRSVNCANAGDHNAQSIAILTADDRTGRGVRAARRGRGDVVDLRSSGRLHRESRVVPGGDGLLARRCA